MTLNLAKLRAETLALIDGTTPGPWREGQDGNTRVYGPDGMGAHSGLIASFCRRADARLVTATPTLAADTLRLMDEIEARDAEIERLSYVLDGVAAAIDTGRNEPLHIWREQIEIARAALAKGGPDDR